MATADKARLALLVVGVGRSGTSLAMQALGQLGVMGPADPVPADENNLRGTGEDAALRDRFVSLRRALGPTQGLLPPSWRSHPATRETADWLRDYLSETAARSGGGAFAMKFPAASVFLPLWQEAAEALGLRLRVIWATRNAADICRSMSRAYASSLTSSVLFHADRSFYILKDAPADTLLLPYEGWRTDPAAQVAALAEAAEVSDPDLIARARDAFASHLDHGGAGEPVEIPPAVRAFDEALIGRLGRLGDILPEGSTGRLGLLAGLADLVADLTHEQPGALTRSDDGIEARIGFLRALSASNSDETRMKTELDILTQRIRDVSAENRTLRADLSSREQAARDQAARKPAAQPEAAQRAGAAVAERTAKLEAELAKQRQAVAALTEEKQRALAEAAELRRAYASLTKAHDRLEEELTSRFHLRLSAADSTGKKIAEERDHLKKQVAALAEQLREGKTQVAALDKRARKAEARVHDLLESTSWRITGPLRRATRMLRHSGRAA